MQPIETAPQDGTRVVVFHEAAPEFKVPAKYEDGEWRAVINTVPVTMHPTHWESIAA